MTTTVSVPLPRVAAGTGLWESGGGMTNSGRATVVTGPAGEALAPLLVNRRGPLAGAEHALLPAIVGGFVVDAEHHRLDYRVTIRRIAAVAEAEVVLEDYDIWDGSAWQKYDEWPPHLEAAVQAASAKAAEYHCREAWYVVAAELEAAR